MSSDARGATQRQTEIAAASISKGGQADTAAFLPVYHAACVAHAGHDAAQD